MEYFNDEVLYKVNEGYVVVDYMNTAFYFTKSKPNKEVTKSYRGESSVNNINCDSIPVFRFKRTLEGFEHLLKTVSQFVEGEFEDSFEDVIFEVNGDTCTLKSSETNFKRCIKRDSLKDKKVDFLTCKFNPILIVDAMKDLNCDIIEISLRRWRDWDKSTVIKIKDVETGNFVVVLPKVDN